METHAPDPHSVDLHPHLQELYLTEPSHGKTTSFKVKPVNNESNGRGTANHLNGVNRTQEIMRSPFGDYLVRAMKERGMSTRELAELSGLSESRPKFLINGLNHPSSTTCRRIADALEIPYDEMWAQAKISREQWGERMRVTGVKQTYRVCIHSNVTVDVKDFIKAMARKKGMTSSKVIELMLRRARDDYMKKCPEFQNEVDYEERMALVHSITPKGRAAMQIRMNREVARGKVEVANNERETRGRRAKKAAA